MAIQINVQNTPNPNSIKISTNETLFEASTSLKSGDATDHPLASALLSIEGVDNIFGIRDFVTVSKEPDADWDAILTQVEEAFNVVYG